MSSTRPPLSGVARVSSAGTVAGPQPRAIRALFVQVQEQHRKRMISALGAPQFALHSDTVRPTRSPACTSEGCKPEPQFDVIHKLRSVVHSSTGICSTSSRSGVSDGMSCVFWRVDRTISRMPVMTPRASRDDCFFGGFQNGSEHLLVPRARQHGNLMFFQNGEGVRVVRLGFSQARGATREVSVQPEDVTSSASLRLPLGTRRATRLSVAIFQSADF